MPLTPPQSRVLDIVLGLPLTPARVIARRAGLAAGYTTEILRSLRDAGLVACASRGGRDALWGTVERVRAEQARKATIAAARATRNAQPDAQPDPVLEPQQRWLRADEAAPARTRAPNSVFQLAAMAA